MKVSPLLMVTVRVFGAALELHPLTLIIGSCCAQVTYGALLLSLLMVPACHVVQHVVPQGVGVLTSLLEGQTQDVVAPAGGLVGHTIASVEGQGVSVGIPATGTTANGPRLSTDSTRSSAIKEEQAIRLWM